MPIAHAQFPTDLSAYREKLREVFGYPDFRSGQAEVLTRLAARDVLGVMHTGSGKSLCYVLPALEVGRTLVVSPLIALMQDQVESLQAAGVAATFINSTIGRTEQNARYRDFIDGRVALLYVAPERFANARFVDGLRAAGVQLLVVDEAHCISEWGHDFRPDYLVLGRVRERLGNPRTLALTATADPLVRRDILARLGISGSADEVVTTFDRPNLRFAVVPVSDDSERLDWLVRYARAHDGQGGIIYARTRRNTEETAAALSAAGVRALPYHAGMAAPDRASAQRRFITGQIPVLVATNAFGMGIDKPDVRYVVHTHIPGRIEAYYQEAGRAGRDGEPAECTLLYARRDAALQRRFIEQAHPSVDGLRAIWRHLVEAQVLAGDRALTPPELDEGFRYDGLPVVLSALRASGLIERDAVRLRSLDVDAQLDHAPIEERHRYALARLGQMVEYAETPGCRRCLVLRYFGEQPGDRCANCDNCTATAAPRIDGYPEDLFAALLDLRAELARDSNRPPYLVFEERTAREIATYRPRTERELLATWGVAERRVQWFGNRVIAIVLEWERAHPDASPPPPRPLFGAQLSARVADGAEVSFDDPVFQRLRSWRRERARVEGVPAYTLFSDRTARELAALRPNDEDALRGVWGMGDARVSAFGPDLLAVLSAAE
jgi:ATP-dependent DNA helicase RecQ